MATPPNFIDLARQQRLAMNNRLSFNSVVNGGAPASQNVAIPVPQINYDYLYVSGLTCIGPGDPNGLYVRQFSEMGQLPFYTKNMGLSTYGFTETVNLGIASNASIYTGESSLYWAYCISSAEIGDDDLAFSTTLSSQQLPAGNGSWPVFSAYGIGGRINVAYDTMAS